MIGQLVNTPIALPFRVLIDQEADLPGLQKMEVLRDQIVTYDFDVLNSLFLKPANNVISFGSGHVDTFYTWILFECLFHF